VATSLGGVETLIQHYASMTNAAMQREESLKVGIINGLIRLSVGIKCVENIVDNLENVF
jgi:cystathionine beta-lyase/cystathionine gamma-synthase